MSDPIAKIIEDAAFTEADIDMATSGLCGTFAFALFKFLEPNYQVSLCLVCCAKDGKPLFAHNHKDEIEHIIWRHAVVEHEGHFYDMEGEVKLEHAVDNYCWGNPNANGGVAVKASPENFLKALQFHPFDDYFDKWTKMLDKKPKMI